MTESLNDLPSLWLNAFERTPFGPSPRPPGRVDVAVIGAGLVGLCTAVLCAEQGASVVVIEAGSIASRTTGHSTAKVTALHGLIYADLALRKGHEVAIRHAAANREAVLRIREVAARLDIDCGLVEADA